MALDRYTLRLKLKDPTTSYMMQSPMAAAAREVIEAHADASGWAMANRRHGPYMLKSWRRGAQIVLEANPNYRDEFFPDSNDPADKELSRRCAARSCRSSGESRFRSSRNPIRGCWVQQRALDYANVPSDLSTTARSGRRLKPEY
jgi:hypothetical protein